MLLSSTMVQLLFETDIQVHATNMLNVSNQTYGSIYAMALDSEVP